MERQPLFQKRLELLGWFVFALCFIKLYFDEMFVAVKFLLEALQMSLEPMISCFYALIITDSKEVINEVVVTKYF